MVGSVSGSCRFYEASGTFSFLYITVLIAIISSCFITSFLTKVMVLQVMIFYLTLKFIYVVKGNPAIELLAFR